jgi:hypothetical protein
LADAFLSRIHEAGERISELEIAGIVRSVIEASEIDHFYESPVSATSIHRADMVVWSDDFEPWIGNPLLVEVKGQLRTQSDMSRAIWQLASMLDRTREGWGLLIFQGEGVDLGDLDLSNSRVLVLPIENLLELLRDRSLGDVLRQLRNLRVHGKG